jgi:hypothetical protein
MRVRVRVRKVGLCAAAFNDRTGEGNDVVGKVGIMVMEAPIILANCVAMILQKQLEVSDRFKHEFVAPHNWRAVVNLSRSRSIQKHQEDVFYILENIGKVARASSNRVGRCTSPKVAPPFRFSSYSWKK